jgi:hypothetical protein
MSQTNAGARYTFKKMIALVRKGINSGARENVGISQEHDPIAAIV